MSETRFTKGPWHVHNNDVFLEIVSEEGQIANTCASGHYFDNGDCVNGVTAVANSHLIAAAPEMYAMLENLSDCDENQMHRLEINKLLAKARGE